VTSKKIPADLSNHALAPDPEKREPDPDPARKLPIIELAGTPAERGRRHGRLLGREIRRLRRAILAYLAKLSLYVGAWPLYGAMLLAARRFRTFIPPEYLEEMAALASGAEIGPGTVLLISVLDDLANNKYPMCLALAAGEGHTLSGAYLMGRNLDYPVFTEIMLELQALFVQEPERGLPVASLGWPAYLGVCTGMNRAGVALAQMTAMTTDHTFQGMPAALRFRQALEAESTVTGAAAHILSRPGTIGNNVMLCGPDQALVLELSAHRWALRWADAGLLTATTHYQSPEMAPVAQKFPPGPPFAQGSPYHFTEEYSLSRDWRLRQLVGERKIEPADLQKILADPHLCNRATVVGAAFAPAEPALWVARGVQAPVTQGPFEKIKPWG
jgi:isopenicillin-N N-acyltransferase-like protein